MTTWADLHAGDVVQARTGGYWQVTRWEDVAGARWLAGGGGGRQRLFTLAPVDGSRPPITAPHVLSDPVHRVFEYDRSAEATAITALAAAFSVTTMEENLMDTPIPTPAACAHPPEAVSKLKGGKIVCTECFATLHDPATGEPVPVDSAAVALAGGGQLDGIVPPYVGVDDSGTEYTIAARDRLAACAAGIHPIVSLTSGPTPGELRCGACGAVLGVGAPAPAPAPGPDPGYRVVDNRSSAEATAAAIGGVVAPAWLNDALIESGTSVGSALAELTDLAYRAVAFDEAPATVANVIARPVASLPPTAVTQVNEPAPPVVAPAVVDAFSDPAGSYEVKRDRWKRYLLPDPVTGEERAWTRASTLARVLSDEYNLTGWKCRMTAIGIAKSEDLAAGVLAIKDPDEPEAKKELKSIVAKAMERAESSRGATLGTALHTFTHRLDRGEPLDSFGAPKSIRADLVEYQATLTRYGLSVVPDLIERIVICPELGAAGTFDRILAQHPGPFSQCPLTVSDLKTGKSVDWSWLDWAIQLSIYANATHMWDPVTSSYVELPDRTVLDRDRALVVHLPVGKSSGVVYGVNLIEGWDAAHLAERVRVIRNSGKGYGWSIAPVNPEALLIQRVAHADGNELARLWDRHHPRGEWTDAVAHAAAERVARLQEVPL